MNPQNEFKNLLRQHSFTLVRQNRHYVYTDGKGRVLVVAKTPSDHFAYNAMIRDLKAVVSNPPPSSLTIEEERQRRELEKNIVLWAERKRNISAKRCSGKGGGHGHAKNGSGFYYEAAKETPFIPEEVKEQARLNKEWDNLLTHCRKQTRRVENELEWTFEQVLPLCIVKQARETLVGMVKMMRAGTLAAAHMEEDMHTRQGRSNIQKFISEKLCQARFYGGEKNEGRTTLMLMLMAAAKEDALVSLDIECPEVFEESIKEQIRTMLGGALFLTAIVWSHMDGYKPKWLMPFVELQREKPLLNRARKMVKRVIRQARRGMPVDPKVVKALERIPSKISKPLEEIPHE